MRLHVGPGATIVYPARTRGSRAVTLSQRHSRAESKSPLSRNGMPQHPWGGTTTSQPFFSRTPTAARPISGLLELTAHVTKRATRSAFGARDEGSVAPPRRFHHAEKVSGAHAGSSRSR